jgi:undecaprenyl-diphosphatase
VTTSAPPPLEPPTDSSALQRFDDAIDELLERVRGREPLDRIIYAVTELADFSLLWHLIAWSRALRSDRELDAAIRLSVCLGIESVLVNGVVKSAFKRERPVYQGERPHKLRIPLTTSFPSGHASSAVVAAILLSENSRLAPVYWALAGAVAVSRVHVRIHHASDVLGGAAVGLVLGTAFRRLWPLRAR